MPLRTSDMVIVLAQASIASDRDPGARLQSIRATVTGFAPKVARIDLLPADPGQMVHIGKTDSWHEESTQKMNPAIANV